jgi:hypothetical protein
MNRKPFISLRKTLKATQGEWGLESKRIHRVHWEAASVRSQLTGCHHWRARHRRLFHRVECLRCSHSLKPAPVPQLVWNASVGLADTRVFFRATHAGACYRAEYG